MMMMTEVLMRSRLIKTGSWRLNDLLTMVRILGF